VAQVAAEFGRLLGGDRTAKGPPAIGAGGGAGAHVLRFPGPRSQGSLALASPDPGEPFALPLYAGGQPIPPALSLLESPIRDGAIFSLGGPEGGVAPESGGRAEIRVVSGPGAGSVYWLPAGCADIGTGPVDVRV
jgi:DNA segregation ATPase FtsK/SpoIIIE, S-DNA-T family